MTVPYLLDFYPLETEKFTRIHKFYENLKANKFTTTKCKSCNMLHWQPRIICPNCLGEDLDWIELPKKGVLYSYSAVVLGAPLGMEKDAPFVVGIVKLENDLKIFSRIDDIKYDDCKVGMNVELKIITLPDGRVFFRFKPV